MDQNTIMHLQDEILDALDRRIAVAEGDRRIGLEEAREIVCNEVMART